MGQGSTLKTGVDTGAVAATAAARDAQSSATVVVAAAAVEERDGEVVTAAAAKGAVEIFAEKPLVCTETRLRVGGHTH